MGKGKSDHLHGTLDLLVLRSLCVNSMHGWAISKHIQLISQDVLEVNQGSLYPALYRLPMASPMLSPSAPSVRDSKSAPGG